MSNMEILTIFLENDVSRSDGKIWLNKIEDVLSKKSAYEVIENNVTYQEIRENYTVISDVFNDDLYPSIKIKTITFRKIIQEWVNKNYLE